MDEILATFGGDGSFFEQPNNSSSFPDLDNPFDSLDPAPADLLPPAQDPISAPPPTASQDFLRLPTESPPPSAPSTQALFAAPTANALQQPSFELALDPSAVAQAAAVASAAAPPPNPSAPPTSNTATPVNSSVHQARGAAVRCGNAANVAAAVVARAPPKTVAKQTRAPPQTDSVRRRLRPAADVVVAYCWRTAASPASFARKLRSKMPLCDAQTVGKGKRLREEPVSAPASKRLKVASGAALRSVGTTNRGRKACKWTLSDDAEGAVLDALISRMCQGEAASMRLLNYLRHLILVGVVRTRCVIATCLVFTGDPSDRSMHAIARLFCELLPNYAFSSSAEELTAESCNFLDAFILVLDCTRKSPYLAKHLALLLRDNRLISLVRACGRRVKPRWTQILSLVALLEADAANGGGSPSSIRATNALSVSPELALLFSKLRLGLGSGSTSFETIAKVANANVNVPTPAQGLNVAIQAAVTVIARLFGAKVGQALIGLWTNNDRRGVDLASFEMIENGVQEQMRQPAYKPQLSLRDSVRACEATIRFLTDHAESVTPASHAQWTNVWGGRERLLRIVRDTVPQLRNKLLTEVGCMLVAMAVVGSAAIVLGPALRVSDEGVVDEDVEKHTTDLVSFAVGCMEDAAQAEETPAWRSFGLWLLLFASRCGSMLRDARCEHVKAARVLRAWGSMPTGTPGAHTGGGANSQHRGTGASSSSASSAAASAAAEVVATFAAPAAHAIVDMSDVNGEDATLLALCSDYIQ